ncbi:MAG: hypothetical protein JW931_07780 [Methanomicrobiaceae archaeon]|nr:hypothetical protein [Methanomicrobiaceae archaeon]
MVHIHFNGLSEVFKPMEYSDLYEHDEYWPNSGYSTSSLNYSQCIKSGDVISFVSERDEAD